MSYMPQDFNLLRSVLDLDNKMYNELERRNNLIFCLLLINLWERKCSCWLKGGKEVNEMDYNITPTNK
jgi:hypothetical protein